MAGSGKRVIVTGAASGIGRATVGLLRSEGASVVSVDLRDPGDDPSFIKCDVADSGSVAAMVDEAVTGLGGLDAVVNVAGIQRSGAVEVLDETDWDDQLRVNVKSCFLTSKYAVPHLRAAGGGSITTTASLAGLKGFAGMTAYSASKGAVIAFTRTLAVEVAADNIRANCLCPGWVDTPFNDPVITFEGGREAHLANVKANVPLSREAAPPELAKWHAFLVSDAASYMTGQAITVDGGLSA
ncbi:SDR family NAD(P)-dependent oxidoreductase [Saccharopolyspora spinosa]|uniref:Dihydroanticapsin dehydrogenase n=1 Tax=Saccharopolyspora spinosa TaxID=60894 RepID=Q6JHM5_SACSN|nr:SDR family NAD(P)-dependent oxidoreductase [Saccharopolyspora spinosa]AAS00432.1 putative oxidoreductase, short chain dehydrogenase [Saccharopolyspora spinosa NRRL 18395]PKW16151.1 dihydroanticapsin dehydrogenase [Saccharopolyspora spinosa]